MNRHVIRLAGPLTGLVLATMIGVTPVLAAPEPTAAASTSRAGQAEELNSRIYCAREWSAARASATVRNLQAVGTCEIDRRLATIGRLDNAVDDARALTDAHEAALEVILDNSAAGLRALREEIEADTTVEELRADIKRIFEDFRIYALVTRQVWLVTAADTVNAAGAALNETAADLASLIAQAEANGKDVTVAKAALEAMQAAIDEALAGVDGLASEVLPLTPADWNAGTAGPVLREAREAIAAARADLRRATAEARQVIAALA
ncbi:MAG: hypothetical protein C0498_13100 [Anaerolinea sp.]|nr:hypothetical protein [Anaerolinea sp.]